MAVAALTLGFALIAAAAWLGAALLPLRALAEFLLAFYLFLLGGVIAVVLALSPFGLVTRSGILAASSAVLAAVAAVWHVRGRPATPSLRAGLAVASAALRDPLVAVLTGAVALLLAYAAALAVATPANDFDVLWYHLPRAAIWAQEHSVHFIEHANDTRLNENPPGAEILSTWAMTLEGSDRFAGVFQVAALVATMIAVVRVSRLAGFGHREAAFGALLYATLPVVALQAATAANDLVFTSFVVSVVAFMLSDNRTSLALGALALTLAVATKGTALFAIPLLLVVGIVLAPRRRWLSVAAVGAGAIAMGALWYVYHHAAAGGAGEEQRAALSRSTTPSETPLYMWRNAIDAVDPAGSVGRDRYAYVVVAVVLLAIVGVVAWRRRSRALAWSAGLVAGLLLVPAAFESAHDVLRRGYERALIGRVDERLVFLGEFREPTLPTPFTSWYGPAGLIAFLIAAVLAVRAVRRGMLRRGVLVLALAPLITLVVVSSIWGYSPSHGRFFMPAVALSAATWGLVHRVRALAWGLSAIALVTLLLSFLHYREKPAGISLLEGTTSRSVWTADRITVLSVWRPAEFAQLQLVHRLDDLVEDGETVALRVQPINLSYQYFDRNRGWRIVYVDSEGGLDADVDWLVVAPKLDAGICPTGWRRELGADGWQLYRRVGLCPGERPAA